MHITLEMVDEIINRTGVTYKEAKEALEASEGDILKALCYLEDVKAEEEAPKTSKKLNGQEIVAKLKGLVNDGLVTQITIEKGERKVIDIPVMAGAIAAMIFTMPIVAGIIAAVATGCTIKIVKKDGEIVNINEFTQDKFDQIFKPAAKASEDTTEERTEAEIKAEAEAVDATPEEGQSEDWFQN